MINKICLYRVVLIEVIFDLLIKLRKFGMFFFKVYLNNFNLLYVFVIIIVFIINECF